MWFSEPTEEEKKRKRTENRTGGFWQRGSSSLKQKAAGFIGSLSFLQ